MVDCGACQHSAFYSTSKVYRQCFSEENSCDVGRSDLTEESSDSSARVRARKNNNASLLNFNCFVWVRCEVSYTDKTLCIEQNMGEHSVRDINCFFYTFTAIVDLSRFNNSCLKSPASTLVDLTFQSRALRSFRLNQLRNLSL